MIVGDNIFVMLVEKFFRTFTPKALCDATKQLEVIVCPSIAGKKVDEMVCKAVAAGGSTPNELKDHIFMHQHGFQDLDGHRWNSSTWS